MHDRHDRPLIVQSDLTVLLDESSPSAGLAKERLVKFTDAVKRAGSIHTYRISALSLWNAAAAGISANEIIEWLTIYGRYDLPFQTEAAVRKLIGRYGRLQLTAHSGKLLLQGDALLMEELSDLASISDVNR